MMKLCFIANPASGSAAQLEAIKPMLQDHPLWLTQQPGDAVRLAARAAQEGYEAVVAVGGDGTVNEVANGLITSATNAALGIVPLGTGNDLARTLGLSNDPVQALTQLQTGRRAPLDAIAVWHAGNLAYAVNVASGGIAGIVAEQLTSELKQAWGPLAYLLGTLKVLPDIEPYETLLRLDDEVEQRVRVLNLFVANGRWVAGGKLVAPHARVDDGLLDVVILEMGSVMEMAALAARFAAGGALSGPCVHTRRARRIEVRSTPGLAFNVDGEWLTDQPVSFEVLPAQLQVLVGPDYDPAPPAA